MTIKIGIAASRADLVESELRNFTFTKSEAINVHNCYIFTIECNEVELPRLCAAFLYAGIDAGRRYFQPI